MNPRVFFFMINGLLFFQMTYAQPQVLLDSLMEGYYTAESDSQKYIYASELFWEYINVEPDTGFYYAQQALGAAERMEDKEKKARSLNFWGIYYRNTGNYALADSVMNISITLQKEVGDTVGLSRSYGNMANLYDAQGNYEETIEMNLKAMELYEFMKDTVGIGICLNNIGRIHYLMKQHEQAKDFFSRALEISTAHKDSLGMAQNLGNIGIIEKQLENFEGALAAYEESMSIFKKINQPRSVAYNLMNIGLMHRELEEYAQAEQYMLNALQMLEALEDPRAVALLYDNLGKNFLLQDNYNQSLYYARKAESLAGEVGAKYELRNAYQTIYKSYEGLGDYRQAFDYQEKYLQLKDSLLNESNTAKIQELEAKYENERKEKEIAQLNVERAVQEATIQKQKVDIRTRNGVIGGVLLALALAAFATNNYRQKQKLAKQEQEIEYQKRVELQNQQKLLMMDAMIEGQENERRRVAKDLHDGVGSLLAALKIQVGSMGETEKSAVLDKTYQMAGNAYEEVRRVAHNMMPQALIDQGLTSAVKQLVRQVGDSSGLDIHWQLLGNEPQLKSNEEMMVYRIVQELLNNIVKHAEASEVWVQISEEDHHHVLMVEDDGKGFDMNDQPEGMGLENLRSRAEYLGAEIEMDSRLGEGTAVNLFIPKL